MVFGRGCVVGLIVFGSLLGRLGLEAHAQSSEPPPIHKNAPKGTLKPCVGKIRIRGLQFSPNDFALDSHDTEVLNLVAKFLRERCPDSLVLIEGHTDAQGSAAHNRDLSEKRAQAVKDYLVEKGVPAEHLSTKGFGGRRPIAPSDTAAGRALNRRVTLRFRGGNK